jgi:hypothetical protein
MESVWTETLIVNSTLRYWLDYGQSYWTQEETLYGLSSLRVDISVLTLQRIRSTNNV